MHHSLLMRILTAILIATSLLAPTVPAHAATARIKDIVNIEGVRDNQLVGYGLVVGLAGTGDSLNNSPFTKQSLQAMLERLGVNTAGENMRTANVAAVMVTANLPAFSTQGSRLDVSVASLGDASSLQGGTLLVTPLLGADGEVYAIAQGSVTINGFKASGDAATVISGVPTTGRISSGGLIEREIGFTLGAQRSLRLSLKNPDFTTSRRVALSINDFIGSPSAVPEDQATVRVSRQQNFNVNLVNSDLAVVKESVSLQQLVDGLNALGISPRDLIAILQAIKAAGALQADIEVM